MLYELAWRLVISFRPFDERLAAALASAADPAPSADLPPRQRIEIACWLLDHHRKDGNRAAFDRWASVVEAHSREGSDRRAAVTYQRLLRLRDDLDFRALSAGLGEPPGEDPAWGLRWAALHCDCGQTGDAERIVARTLAELRTRQSADRYSVWIRSRRAWAEWLSRAHIMTRPGRVPDEWPTEFREPRCDPWTEIEGLERAVAEGLRNRRDGAEHVEPGYDAGTYTDRRNTIHLTSSSEIGAAGVLGSIMEAAGIPVRIGPVDLVGQLAQDAEELAFIPGASWHLCRLRTAKDLSTASLDSRFGRVSIASLEAENVVALWSATWRAASYWHERMVRPNAAGVDLDYAGEQLRLHVELLSRLVARRSREDALACLALARDLGRDVRSLPWMAHEQIGHLLNRAGAAVGPFADPDAMLLALEFPLSSEAGAQADRWPNPTGTSAGWLLAAGSTRPMGDSRWTSRVGMLLDAVRASGPERAEAAVRLTHLADADALTGQETASFRDAVWSRLETGVPAWPAGLTLFPHVVARLPAPVTFNPSAAARSLLFDTPLPPDGLERLEAIAAAACEDGRHAPMLPDAAQAARLFDQVVSMPADPAEPGTPAAAFRGPLRRSCEEAAARVLARSVVPSLRPEDVTADRLTSLNAAAGRLPAGDFLEALPRFTLIGPEVTTDLLSRLRRAAVEGKPGAAFAIVAWARLARSGLAAPVPLDLLAQAVSAVETVRGISLNAFLWCARRLVEAGMLPPPMTDRLTEVLGASLDTKGYHPTILGGGDAVAVPLVRAECVRLAAALKESGQTGTFIESWLALAAVDPLPEVRHALSTATFI